MKGYDDENGKIFDSSKDRGNLFSFQLGAGQVSNICLILYYVSFSGCFILRKSCEILDFN